jgi:hypothetical protein
MYYHVHSSFSFAFLSLFWIQKHQWNVGMLSRFHTVMVLASVVQ